MVSAVLVLTAILCCLSGVLATSEGTFPISRYAIDKAELDKYNHVYENINNNTAQVQQLEGLVRMIFGGVIEIIEDLALSQNTDAEMKEELDGILSEAKGSVTTLIEQIVSTFKNYSACDTTVGYDLRQATASVPFSPSPGGFGDPSTPSFYLSQFIHNGVPCMYNIYSDGIAPYKTPAYMVYSGMDVEVPDTSNLLQLLPTTRSSHRRTASQLYGDIQSFRDAIKNLPSAILRQASSTQHRSLGYVYMGARVNTTCGPHDIGSGVDYLAPMQLLSDLIASLVQSEVGKIGGHLVVSIFGDELFDLDVEEIAEDPSKYPKGPGLNICLYQDNNAGFNSVISETTKAVNRAFAMIRLAMNLPLATASPNPASTPGAASSGPGPQGDKATTSEGTASATQPATGTTPVTTTSVTTVTNATTTTQPGQVTTTTPSSSSGGGNACFPGDAEVELENGSVISMENLSIGDSVKVGADQFSKVFMFTHKLANINYDFITIGTTKGDSLTLTKDHYLYADDALVPASNVRVGAKVLLGNGEADFVSFVKPSQSRGLYNPQTIHGDIVVNGVVSSTYTAAVHPTFAHALLGPLRFLHSFGIHVKILEAGFFPPVSYIGQ